MTNRTSIKRCLNLFPTSNSTSNLGLLLSLLVIAPAALAEPQSQTRPQSRAQLREQVPTQARVETASIKQSIQTKRSVVRFRLESQIAQFQGRMTDFSGTVEVDSRDGTPTAIELRIDIGAVEVDTRPEFDLISPEAVFRSIPDPVATFRSKTITQAAKGQYKVVGTLRRGGRSWQLNLPFQVVRSGPLSSEYIVKLSGPVLAGELPLLNATGGGVTGTLNGRILCTAKP